MYDFPELKPNGKEMAIAILIAVAVLVVIFCAGYMFGICTAGTGVPDNGDGVSHIREQLGTAQEYQREITEGIGSAKEGAARIETGVQHITDSVEQSSAAVSEAAGLIDQCQQIIGTVRNRGKTDPSAH